MGPTYCKYLLVLYYNEQYKLVFFQMATLSRIYTMKQTSLLGSLDYQWCVVVLCFFGGWRGHVLSKTC